MKELKITKGEWRYISCNSPESELAITTDFTPICNVRIVDKYNKDIEAIANAQLIADAGTTANKCGKLPSELLSERDELIKMLDYSSQELTSCFTKLSKFMELTQNDLEPIYDIEKLITKITGK